jgi:hypothetical protein
VRVGFEEITSALGGALDETPDANSCPMVEAVREGAVLDSPFNAELGADAGMVAARSAGTGRDLPVATVA